jgi:uncharacterized membrane protein YeaQ/YmgE (transglycosylase-associated protein family)
MPDVISTTFTLGDLITAFFGAVLLILLANLILRKRRK